MDDFALILLLLLKKINHKQTVLETKFGANHQLDIFPWSMMLF